MLLAFVPGTFENLSIGEVKGSSSMFKSISILTIVFVSIGPGKNPFALYYSISPFTHIFSIVDVRESTLAVELAIFEIALVDTRV